LLDKRRAGAILRLLNISDSKPIAGQEAARELAGHFDVLRQRILIADKDTPVTQQPFSVNEAHVILSVGTKGEMTMSEIAKALHLSLSSVTAIIDKLEDKKSVRRVRSDRDRRIVRVGLTGQGKKFHDLFEKAHLKLTLDILGTLSREEQAELLRLFRKIVARFDLE